MFVFLTTEFHQLTGGCSPWLRTRQTQQDVARAKCGTDFGVSIIELMPGLSPQSLAVLALLWLIALQPLEFAHHRDSRIERPQDEG